MEDTKSIENMTFEEALEELTELVGKLDSDQSNLSDAIKSFERGVALKNFCEKKLSEAKLKVEKIAKSADGNLVIESESE